MLLLDKTDGQAPNLDSSQIRGSIESKVYDRLGHQDTGQNKGLSLAALNVNGLRSHHDEVSSLITEKGIHILALNETNLVNSYPKELTNIEGYQQEREDRNAIGGGVALYIREPIQYTRRTDLPESDLEFICVEIKPPKSRPYIVIVWYRPPSDPVDSFNKLETIIIIIIIIIINLFTVGFAIYIAKRS